MMDAESNRVIDLVRQVLAEQNKPWDEDVETDEQRLARWKAEDEWIGSLTYKGNSVSWMHSKAKNYGGALDKIWDALRAIGVPCDGNTHAADAIREFCTTRAALLQAAETARREAYEEAAKVPAQSTNEGMANVPCRFGCKTATSIYYVPKGCACWNDPVQALCEQHAIKAQSEGPITLIARVHMAPEEMHRIATVNSGQSGPKRYCLPPQSRCDDKKDPEWIAARDLVERGLARWMNNHMAPGIELTDKPLDPPAKSESDQ